MLSCAEINRRLIVSCSTVNLYLCLLYGWVTWHFETVKSTEFHSGGVICQSEALQDLGQKHLSESDF